MRRRISNLTLGLITLVKDPLNGGRSFQLHQGPIPPTDHNVMPNLMYNLGRQLGKIFPFHQWNLATRPYFRRQVDVVARGAAVTMSRVTTRSYTRELGCVCGPVQLIHPPVAWPFNTSYYQCHLGEPMATLITYYPWHFDEVVLHSANDNISYYPCHLGEGVLHSAMGNTNYYPCHFYETSSTQPMATLITTRAIHVRLSYTQPMATLITTRAILIRLSSTQPMATVITTGGMLVRLLSTQPLATLITTQHFGEAVLHASNGNTCYYPCHFNEYLLHSAIGNTHNHLWHFGKDVVFMLNGLRTSNLSKTQLT